MGGRVLIAQVDYLEAFGQYRAGRLATTQAQSMNGKLMKAETRNSLWGQGVGGKEIECGILYGHTNRQREGEEEEREMEGEESEGTHTHEILIDAQSLW